MKDTSKKWGNIVFYIYPGFRQLGLVYRENQPKQVKLLAFWGAGYKEAYMCVAWGDRVLYFNHPGKFFKWTSPGYLKWQRGKEFNDAIELYSKVAQEIRGHVENKLNQKKGLNV